MRFETPAFGGGFFLLVEMRRQTSTDRIHRPVFSSALSQTWSSGVNAMPDRSAIKQSGVAAQRFVFNNARAGIDRTGHIIAIAGGAISASLSALGNFSVDPQLIGRISAASSTHGVSAADLLSKLPGELSQMGTTAVDAFLNGGDALGKRWSTAKSLWEDGSANTNLGTTNASWLEQFRTSADNHRDGLLAAARTPEFWQRTLGNAIEASVTAAAITAVDQLLIHRDELINGNHDERRTLLLDILKTSGLMAAGAMPVSVVLALALMLVPGLTVAMGPLGLLGTAGLGLRLVSSTMNHPSRQEIAALEHLRGELQALVYELQRDSDGNLTITVEAEPIC